MNRFAESRRSARIAAVVSHLPDSKLTNEQLAEELGGDWTAEKILEKTGISRRSIAAEDQCASDLGVEAAEKLFEGGICRREQIDFLLFCTQSPDYFLPTTACAMQHRLGLRRDSGALDFNQGCSGFVYGLALAKCLVESGGLSNVLLITAETYSKFINKRDRSVRTIFGDGAAATLIRAETAQEERIGPFVFGTDGAGAPNLIVPAGGMRKPLSESTSVEKPAEAGNWRSENNLFMNGPEIFNFTLRVVPATVSQLLSKSGLEMNQVDHFVFHQANRFMLERLRAKLGIDTSRFWLDMEDCGNTVSSTIPIALETARSQNRIKENDRIMLVGFGVGYSWSGAMIKL